ncbi:tyrosine-type recombinase/integrase [Maribacter halichondriae]|uniref:tyrosine-type recombinase/integrase n=1 Tax=Maribacter halichondriae TaxID=2980554 RepID=UPI002358ED54|nr:tyrosine-type recombinase/integrase [Maribacter sp. Hal144]
MKLYVDYSKLQVPSKKIAPPTARKIELPALSESDAQRISAFRKWMQQRRLSENTVNTYAEVTVFYLRYISGMKLDLFSAKSIERFNYDFIIRANRSISYQNQCINGIKKYFEFKGIPIEQITIERPRKPRKLPLVLTQDEVKGLLDATTNLKHKALLTLIYSSGLRIGEALSLKINDVDSKRKLIFY